MLFDALVRANLWAERHKTLANILGGISFWLVCADYARFIDLPEIVTLPALVTGLLTGLRYALWEGWLKRELAAAAAAGEAGAEPVSERSRRRAEARAARRSAKTAPKPPEG